MNFLQESSFYDNNDGNVSIWYLELSAATTIFLLAQTGRGTHLVSSVSSIRVGGGAFPGG
jgi:hypothetical protein